MKSEGIFGIENSLIHLVTGVVYLHLFMQEMTNIQKGGLCLCQREF